MREASKESQSAWLLLEKRAHQGINDTLSSLAFDAARGGGGGGDVGAVRRRRRLTQVPANGYCRDNPNYRLHIIYEAQDGGRPASRAAREETRTGGPASKWDNCRLSSAHSRRLNDLWCCVHPRLASLAPPHQQRGCRMPPRAPDLGDPSSIRIRMWCCCGPGVNGDWVWVGTAAQAATCCGRS